jgi:hypothetical protein
MKVRLLPVIAALVALLLVAGCGGSSSSSSGDPAQVAPKGVPVFIEATIQPQGTLKEDVESLAKQVGGIDDLGELIVSEAEKAANSSGEPLDFEKEIQPWLGEQAGMYLESYDGDEFNGYGVAIEVTDSGAAEEFVKDHSKSEDGEEFEEGSYEGVDYVLNKGEETVVGVFDDFLVVGEDLKSFKAMVGASGGESLAEDANYEDATTSTPDGSIANVYVDVGGLIEESGGAIDPEAKNFLDTVGIKPEEATALASVLPGSDQLEIDVTSNLGGENPPSGDASKLLGELPAGSVAAIASAEFGKRFGAAIDQLDEHGIPGQIPPHELKKTMKAAGIDLEKISSSVGDLGVFAEGNSESNLGGAAIFEVESATEAKNTVANVGLLLRATKTPGVTAISGKYSGFSVRSADLGPEPLVVAASGERVAVAYGLPAVAKALSSGGATLSSSSTYKEAVSALGSTPISGFIDGPAALRLAQDLVPADKRDGFDEAKTYLRKIDYVAIGGGSAGERSTVKLIAGVK